jgi:hypothetical protein
MKLTKKQKQEILPHLQTMVQGNIDAWESQRRIEGILEKNFDCMNDAAQDFAVVYGSGDEVTLADVQSYVEQLEEE